MMFVQRFAGSGYNDGEVETYSSGGHGTSPRGIDINQLPSTTECEEETVLSTSSPSSIGMMKRGRQEKCFHEFDLERERACDLSSRGGSDDEDGGTTRKKLRLSKEQSALLEESFKDHITLSPVCMSAFLNSLLTFIAYFTIF
jgi:homeobox-leucine zipper protein